MQLDIRHRTTYRFDGSVSGALQELRLRPSTGATQRVAEWEVELDGGIHEVAFADHHANAVDLVSLEPGAVELHVTARGVVETIDTGGVVGGTSGHAPSWLYLRSTALTAAGPGLEALLATFEVDAEPIATVHALSAHVRAAIDYELGWTDAATSAEDAIAAGRGVCQDHSHVFLAALRALGVPARYVSGYLFLPDQADHDASHAWVEAWLEGLGWVGFDVVNGISPDERYVRVAIGLDYREAAPVYGLRFGDASESLDVAVQVQQ
ncbi:MAG: transglutaminase family protein [Actinomycetota bacterium]